jgi:FkbM family methyltransferase
MSFSGRFIAKKYLKRANEKHLAEFPQLACFSFDLITTSIHLDGQYERDQLAFLAHGVFPTLPSGGACIDVGANIGNHSLHFARSFDKVIALEPHPRTFRLLSLNAELVPNIVALNLGASSDESEVAVFDNPLNIGATGVDRLGTGTAVKFRLQRIDDVNEVQALERITFMKFDVEGHERFAIEGARRTILMHKPLIVLEVLPDEIVEGTSPALDLLRSLGYHNFYQPVETGLISKLPLSLRKLARTLKTIFTGARPSKASRLAKVIRLESRSYPMLLCTTMPLALDSQLTN